jgi:two-component system nitrogen regulation response regulator NtrX
MPTILLVDDEPGVRSALGGVLRDEGYDVDAVDSGEACLDCLAGRRTTSWSSTSGCRHGRLATLRGCASGSSIAGRDDFRARQHRVGGRAIKMGAFDFVEKPLSLEKTVLVVRNALRQRRLEVENRRCGARSMRTHDGRRELRDAQLREQVAMAAPTNGRVLIYGENGTGKELVRGTSTMSRRRAGPFIEVNCAAIPEGADRERAVRPRARRVHGRVADRRGKFELAHGGTMFLDEIGDMTLKTQAKVLRVLQEQVMEPVGDRRACEWTRACWLPPTRILPTEIRAGRFREDLYFRLNVVPIFVPPLRERQTDIPLLAEHFMALLAREYGRRPKVLDAGRDRSAAAATHGPAMSVSCATWSNG